MVATPVLPLELHRLLQLPSPPAWLLDGPCVSGSSSVTVQVPVSFINEEASPGLKRGAVLNIVRHEVEVNCPANAIPSGFEIDVTGLDVNDSIHVSMIDLPKGVEPTITDRDFTIATLAAPSGLRSAAAGESGEEAGEEDSAEEGES